MVCYVLKGGNKYMKILFYDTKKYDRESFDKIIPEYKDIQIEYAEEDISERTAKYAKGYDSICAFVSSDVSEKVLKILKECGVKLVPVSYTHLDVYKRQEVYIYEKKINDIVSCCCIDYNIIAGTKRFEKCEGGR